MRTLVFVALLWTVVQSFASDSKYDDANLCMKGISRSCKTLRDACDIRGEAKACFHLAYALGMQGKDFDGLSYLRKACAKGEAEACRFILEIEDYIKEKYSGKKASL